MSGLGTQPIRFTLLAGSLALAGGAIAQQRSSIPDAQIEANVLRALASAPELSTQNIQSSTVYGTVTLTGNVHDEALRTKAEDLVSRATGVKKVIDELSLGDTPASGEASNDAPPPPSARAQQPPAHPAEDQSGNAAPDGNLAPVPSEPSEQASDTPPLQRRDENRDQNPNDNQDQNPAQQDQTAQNQSQPQPYPGQLPSHQQPGYGTPQSPDGSQYPGGYGPPQNQQPYPEPQQGQAQQPYPGQQPYGQPQQPYGPPQGQQPYGAPPQNQQTYNQYPGQQPYPNQQPYPGQPQPYSPPDGRRPMYQNPPQVYYPAQGGQPAGVEVTVPAGALLRIRINRGLDSNHIQPGAPFDGTILSDIVSNGAIAIPRGATVQGTVVDAKKAGTLKGQGELGLEISSVTLGGNVYPISTEVWQRNGRDKSTTTVNSALGVGALGAIIGGIAGGGAGAAVGAGVGAGVGVAGAAGAPGGSVVIPPETVLTFRTAQPAVVRTVSQEELARLAYSIGQPYGPPQPRPVMRRYYSPYYGYYYAPYPYAR